MKGLPSKRCSPKGLFICLLTVAALVYCLTIGDDSSLSILFKTKNNKEDVTRSISNSSRKITYKLATKPIPPKTTSTVALTSTTTIKQKSLIEVYDFSQESDRVRIIANNQKCVKFAAPGGGTVICIYPAVKDKYVSGSLATSGMWEFDLVKRMEYSLRQIPDMELLDLGCNIGVFTIYAAKLGRRVVGVDANNINLAMLSRALSLNRLQQKVTLINNAVSDVYESVVLMEDPGNNGGMYVQTADVKASQNTTVQTITLDDLAPMFIDKRLFIKMDIEGSELKALKSSSAFFKTVDVRFVMMEMMWTRKTHVGKAIFGIMSDYNFNPYSVNIRDSLKVLSLDTMTNWPDNVIWIKST